VGTRILVGVDPAKLRAALGVLVLTFVAVSHFRLVPRLSDRLTRRLSPLVVAAAGVLQGATGQSGPIISIFFFQLELPRAAFLFVLNAFFLAVDAAQTASLAAHGVYTRVRIAQAAAVACLALPSLALALRVHDRLSEALFRRVVLIVLALTGVMLIVRAVVQF
jgi:uncharacterized membrane protein YfcA